MKDKDNDIWCDECKTEFAEYKYEGKNYCSACLLEQLVKEEEIVSWQVNHYICNDEYCGNDDQDGVSNVIEQISDTNKRLHITKIEIEEEE
jgi:uncharacterized Zn finger protein (UPF0148 family)